MDVVLTMVEGISIYSVLALTVIFPFVPACMNKKWISPITAFKVTTLFAVSWCCYLLFAIVDITCKCYATPSFCDTRRLSQAFGILFITSVFAADCCMTAREKMHEAIVAIDETKKR